MFNKGISNKALFWEKKSYINDAIIFNQLNIMVPYVDIIGLCYSVAILWEILWCGINVKWGGCACLLRDFVNRLSSWIPLFVCQDA